MLGAYLSHHADKAQKHKYLLGMLLLLGLFFTIAYTLKVNIGAKRPNSTAFGEFTPNTVAISMSLFTFLRQFKETSERQAKLLAYISDKMFIVYLIHPLILPKVFSSFPFLRAELFHLRIPLCALLTFVICIIIATVLRFIFRKRYIIG